VNVAALVDLGLALLTLGLAVWVIASSATYRAAEGFVAYGLVVALVWVRLGSVDVALTEAALGSGLTGLLLLRAAARVPPEDPAETAPPGQAPRLLAALLSAIVTVGLAAVVLLLPEPAPTLAPAAAASLPATGVGNPVTAVLLAYRAVDTLGESIVLVLALVGLWSLAPDAAWGGRPGSLRAAPVGSALRFLAQVLPPFGILVGIHLLWVGADHPGGKFQGATVLAAMWVLVIVAGLRRPPPVTSRRMRWLVAVGSLLFIGIGTAGIWLAQAFLAYPDGLAKPLILVIEAGLTLSVAVILGLLLAGPPEPEQPMEAQP
jgi:multisubunit Na+/H+ antiporter MnhB subunit